MISAQADPMFTVALVFKDGCGLHDSMIVE